MIGVAALIAVAVLDALLPGHAHAGEVMRGDPDSYLRLLTSLTPGQTLELAPGEYLGGLPVHRLNGEPGRPIVIRGAQGKARPRFLARAGHNTVSIVDSSHVEITGLHLDGLNLIADAVKAEGTARFAHDITIADLVIVGHGADQSIVGISTMCPAWNWTIRGNLIVGAGTGMYLGHPNGLRPFIGGIIENNVVLNTIGYNLQIKPQNMRPAGLPAERSIAVIRNNVFSKAAGASTGRRARPNVWIGHRPPDGPGSHDVFAIYGNFFHANAHGALLEGEDGVAAYANVFLNPYGDAIRISSRSGTPPDVRIAFNTVIAAREGISMPPRNTSTATKVVGNIFFAGTGSNDIDRTVNLERSYEKWAIAQPNGAGVPAHPASAAPHSELVAFDAALLSDLPDWDRDFEGDRRQRWVHGAYDYPIRNDAWRWALERKPLPSGAGP